MCWKILKLFKLILVGTIIFSLQFLYVNSASYFLNNLDVKNFYSLHNENSIILPPGDSRYERIQLDVPINFFSEKYDHIFINTNGILTFVVEFADYLNEPFPLEYPSIAPFYSNIDTSAGNESTLIIFFGTEYPEYLDKATKLIQNSYLNAGDFIAKKLYIATWLNVGYYKEKNEKLNTFQVAIICDEDDTYVQLIYPENGINWLQAEIGDLGLPDIRAQAGFISEDGRYFTLKGSGTDNVRYLSSQSNIGIQGNWLYRVGRLNYEENINESDNYDNDRINLSEPRSCSEGLYRKCHSMGHCVDTNEGYCCVCNDGYYGNGNNCIKNNIPLRVIGSISGTINNKQLNTRSKLQSYVVTSDGRSYTAINPIDPEFGHQLQLLLPLGSSIGWLFAKPSGKAKNGYQLTGGIFEHLSTLKFKENNEILFINQTFEGLNYWDQLSVKIDINGEMPNIPIDTHMSVNDFTEEYTFITDSDIQTRGTIKIDIPAEDRSIEYDLEQVITFDRCNEAEDQIAGQSVLQKISKIVLDYRGREQAIRISMLNKIGVDSESNPCNDGTANCGENTICIPQDDDYDCVCKNGYAPDITPDMHQYCVDIDECRGPNICDGNAFCKNEAGGYTCTCHEGFNGNGSACYLLTENNYNNEHYEHEKSECEDCSEYATCHDNICICNDGWSGNGYFCSPNCRSDEIWTDGRCLTINPYEDTLEPFCTSGGYCTCPEGYQMNTDEHICKLYYDNDNELKQDEQIPCDVEFNCHENATCEWSEPNLRHECICPRGSEGDGFICKNIEVSCTTNEELCDVHATCVYNEAIGKSECQCDRGYEGDGFICNLAPECTNNEHCGLNAACIDDVCLCLEGYERDISDFCVPMGSCGGTYCAINALCKWESIQKVSYCECMEGYTGDGVQICKSIPIPCNIRNDCGLHASCIPNYRDLSKHECVCDTGYYGDGYVCVEEINCRNTPNLCDVNAKCTTQSTGLQCICNPGFLGNGTSCREISQHESGFLLISQGVVILRIPFDGRLGRPISVAQMAIGLDKDCAEGRVYWGDISAKKIISSKYDGTDIKSFITNDIFSPEGIAVDWISRRLYWTDSSKDTIEVANLDNPNQRAVIIYKYLVNPRGIAVDPYRNKLYWTDWDRSAPKIEMSDLDGTGREILLTSPSVILPNSLVILRDSGDVCFADAGTHKIECIDIYTRNVRTIASNLSYPFGLTVTDNHFYWTDWTTKKIESVDINGLRKQGMRTPVFGSHKMYGMTAILDACPVSYSPCQINNGGCPNNRICLVNKNAPSSKSCKCIVSSPSCPNDVVMDF